jgi:phage terminase large subunit-like protein
MTSTLTPAGPTDSPPAAFVAAADLLAQRTPDSQWRSEARAEQLPPAGDWYIWLVMAGRGWGKTWTGARWLGERSRSGVQADLKTRTNTALASFARAS